MFKKAFSFVLILNSFSFGYVSNLINNNNIIDIGKTTPSNNDVIKVAKIKVEKDPSLQQIPRVVLNQERNITEQATCLIDELNHENCPNDLQTCQNIQDKTNGFATIHYAHKEVPSIYHPPVYPDDVTAHYNSLSYITYNSNIVSSTNPKGVFIEGGYTYSKQEQDRIFYLKFDYIDERVILCVNNKELYYSDPGGRNLADGTKSCGYIYSTSDQYNYSGKFSFSVPDGGTIYWAGLNFHGPNGIRGLKIYSCPADKPLDWSTMTCGPAEGTYTCPVGFKLSDDKTYCYNDYTYYTYSCPTDTNIYDKEWQGPLVSSGGDCLGECGSYGCSCNSATPPNGNCVRDHFYCPSDSSKICTLVPSDNPTEGDSSYTEGYVYSLGHSIKHEKTIESNLTCQIGWTLDINKSKCTKEPDYKCSINNFYYDRELGACIENEVCESGIRDPNTGKCLFEPNYTCPDDGYTYDKGLDKCIKTPYCDRGSFNPLTNKCEEEVGDGLCPTGYSYNKDRNRCEKPITNYIEFTEHRGSLWVGKIGDNYLNGYCTMDSFNTSFNVTDKSLVEEFVVDYAKFDDYIGVVLNNHYVYVGPYGGNTLYVENGHVVYYYDGSTKKTGDCELSTSWEKYLNVDAKNSLINGTNNVKIRVEVAGGGEGYARFHFLFKGRNTIQCLDNNYCQITYSNDCPSGYTYDNSSDICYIDDPNANEDLANKVYWVPLNCPLNGTLDIYNDICTYDPTCPGNDSTIIFDSDNHVCKENAIVNCESGKTLISTTVPGYSNACIDNETCPSGSILTNYGEASYCSQPGIPICPTGSTYNENTHLCEEIAICPVGYKIENGKCVKNYIYYSYYCDSGWEGPVDLGNDCEGNCGPWGCSCNNETPPANNCRKKSQLSYTSKIIQKRPLIKHEVSGSLTPEEFGEKKGYQCGENCQYIVTKIEGKDDKICFTKRNGQIGCFTVDGCKFKGTIDLDNEPIKEIQIGKYNSTSDYPYYIAIPAERKIEIADDASIGCYSNNMIFNSNTRMCEGTSNLIKFTDGGWTMAGADANWIINDYSVEQTVNTSSPALLVSPFDLGEGGILEGDIKVIDTYDNDWIGLVFGYKDDNNYYYIGWTKNSDSWHPYAGFIFSQVKNGTQILLSDAAKNAGGWSPNTTYHLKIEYGPKYMKLYRDGTLILNYYNNDFKVSEGGKVGFYNLSQKDVLFSNFKASSYPKCPEGYTFNESSGQCIQGYLTPSQFIESTCRMYGHVGGINVKTGIVSAIVDKDAKINPLDDLYQSHGVTDYNISYYDPASRIDFWDPYEDHFLGFIEFLKDVKPEDSSDGFKVKDPRVFDIASYGFTAYSPLGTNMYYVSVNPIGYGDMTEAKCDEVANKFGLQRINASNLLYPFNEISEFLTGGRVENLTENPVCLYGNYDQNAQDCINIPEDKPNVKYCLHGVLSDDEKTCIITPRCILKETNKFREINNDDYAYKTIYSNSQRSYKCSPWTCKDHQCAKAVCPSGYLGNLHNAYEQVPSYDCQEQTCDAMLPYYNFCGKQGNCPIGAEYKEIAGECYKLVCPAGSTFDAESQKCVSYICPPNTIPSPDGKSCLKGTK